jgi:hypothetical protein
MLEAVKPGLFGIKNSNRDFENAETWGKTSLILLSHLLLHAIYLAKV